MTTGIGALIIAIGVLINQMQEYSDAAEKAAEEQKKLNERIKNSAEVGLKGEQNYLKNQEKLELAKAKLKGATEEEIFKIQQDYRAQNIRALERNYNETKGIDAVADKEKLDAIKSAIIEGQVAESEYQIKLKEDRKSTRLNSSH